MKFKGANHDGLPQCSSLIGTGISDAFRPNTKKDWTIKTIQEKVPNKVYKKKDATLEPDGQNDMLTWRRLYVSWG